MKVAYDLTLMRPACVLVAVALGGDRRAAMAFDTQDWLLVPTADMKVYEATPEQLQVLVTKTQEQRRPHDSSTF